MLYTIIALLSGSSKPAKAIVVGLSQPPLFLTSTPFACGYSAANPDPAASTLMGGWRFERRCLLGSFCHLGGGEMESHADIDYPVPMSVRSVSDGDVLPIPDVLSELVERVFGLDFDALALGIGCDDGEQYRRWDRQSAGRDDVKQRIDDRSSA